MSMNQVSVSSFQGRALAFLMEGDRIFLRRELFVALALVLVLTGMVLAQQPVNQPTPTSQHKLQHTVAGPNVSAEKTIVGETRSLGKGQVRSWVSLDKNGNPTAVGLTFSEVALSTVPAQPPTGQEGMEVSLALPKEAARTAFKHIGVDWNPQGHPPAKIYDLAHFDFHFYMITEAERAGITAKGDDLLKSRKQPAAEFVPEGYVYVPDSEIPRMGAHWVNPLSKELQGHRFTTTFLYGSYDGRLVFAEPMIARAFLETKTNVTEKIKLPAKYASSNTYYPTQYSVRYDPIKKEYTIALEGMTLR